MLTMIRKGMFTKHPALKTLDYALTSKQKFKLNNQNNFIVVYFYNIYFFCLLFCIEHSENCEKFIDQGGLKVIFALFMLKVNNQFIYRKIKNSNTLIQ
jgi:hypothetical protein